MATKKRIKAKSAKSTTTKTARPKRVSSTTKKKASPKKRAGTRSTGKPTTAKSTTGKKATGKKASSKSSSTRSAKTRASTQIDKARKATSKQKGGEAKKECSAGNKAITIDRRCVSTLKDKNSDQQAGLAEAGKPKLERRKKVQRRRQIDPTTCERDYSKEEVEFMSAMEEYKRKSGRSFPTCSEVLEVIRSLGYTRLASQEQAGASDGLEASDSSQSSSELVGAGCSDDFGESDGWEI